MDPIEDKSLQSDIQEILEEENYDVVYARTMEILENRELIIPEGEEDDVLPAVHKYFNWEGYNKLEADQTISDHADPNIEPTEELEEKFERTRDYIYNVANMLITTESVFGEERLHEKLGMNRRDIEQVRSKGDNRFDMARQFLSFYRNRSRR